MTYVYPRFVTALLFSAPTAHCTCSCLQLHTAASHFFAL